MPNTAITTATTRIAELEKALELLYDVQLILTVEKSKAKENGEPPKPHGYARTDLDELRDAIEGLQATVTGRLSDYRIHVDRTVDDAGLSFDDTNGAPIAAWLGPGWQLYRLWNDDPVELGGTFDMTDGEVDEMARQSLGWPPKRP